MGMLTSDLRIFYRWEASCRLLYNKLTSYFGKFSYDKQIQCKFIPPIERSILLFQLLHCRIPTERLRFRREVSIFLVVVDSATHIQKPLIINLFWSFHFAQFLQNEIMNCFNYKVLREIVFQSFSLGIWPFRLALKLSLIGMLI